MFEFPDSVEDLETVPEEFRGFYAQNNGAGAFMLTNSAIKAMRDSVRTLNNTVTATRRERDEARRTGTALRNLGFDDVAAVETKMAELEEAASKKAGAEEAVQRVRDDLTRTHTAELTRRDAREKVLHDALAGQLVARDSLDAIVAEKGKPKLLQPILKERVRMIEEEGRFFTRVLDENGEPMMDGNGGQISVKGFVAKLKADPEYGEAFEASGNNGSGAQPNGQGKQGVGGENPWKAETKNLTRQQEIIRENPERARSLAAAAGQKPNW